jgi:subtilase family serine protease
VLPVTLQQPDSSGTLAAMNLTGLTVTFKMINAADGTTKIAATSTGVTVVTAASGTVNYDFSSGGVDAAGVYWGTFLVTESGQTDAVPVRQKDLRIIIDSDTQTGEEAYAAAVAAG